MAQMKASAAVPPPKVSTQALPDDILLQIADECLEHDTGNEQGKYVKQEMVWTLCSVNRLLCDFARRKIYRKVVLSMNPEILRWDVQVLANERIGPYIKNLRLLLYDSLDPHGDKASVTDFWDFKMPMQYSSGRVYEGPAEDLKRVFANPWATDALRYLTRIMTSCSSTLRKIKVFTDALVDDHRRYLMYFIVAQMLHSYDFPSLHTLSFSPDFVTHASTFHGFAEHCMPRSDIFKANISRLREFEIDGYRHHDDLSDSPDFDNNDIRLLETWISTLPLRSLKLSLLDPQMSVTNDFRVEEFKFMKHLNHLELRYVVLQDSLSLALLSLERTINTVHLYGCHLRSEVDTWWKVFDVLCDMRPRKVFLDMLRYCDPNLSFHNPHSGSVLVTLCSSFVEDEAAYKKLLKRFRGSGVLVNSGWHNWRICTVDHSREVFAQSEIDDVVVNFAELEA